MTDYGKVNFYMVDKLVWIHVQMCFVKRLDIVWECFGINHKNIVINKTKQIKSSSVFSVLWN